MAGAWLTKGALVEKPAYWSLAIDAATCVSLTVGPSFILTLERSRDPANNSLEHSLRVPISSLFAVVVLWTTKNDLIDGPLLPGAAPDGITHNRWLYISYHLPTFLLSTFRSLTLQVILILCMFFPLCALFQDICYRVRPFFNLSS